MGFALVKTGEKGSMCRDDDGGETVVQSDHEGNLSDQSGNKYRATYDGKDVTFKRTDGSEWTGLWIQGSGATRGIIGGGELSEKFQFTFNDHGDGRQRLNASFIFAGTVDEAIAGLSMVGYSVSSLDNLFNKEPTAPAGGRVLHLRTRGKWTTGAGSGHAIVEVNPETPVATCGTLHVGEYNPTTGIGIGFVLHQKEIHSISPGMIAGIGSVVLSLFCWVNVRMHSSLFDLMGTVVSRRYVLLAMATASFFLAVFAGVRSSKVWWVAVLPAVALCGLLHFHW